jgi:beta-lactamase regulating signal transducer with metallopeptidase domain
MAPTLWSRNNSTQIQDKNELPRSTIAYICAGAGVGLVVVAIVLGFIIRVSRAKSRVRERRKTQQVQRDKLQALNKKYNTKPSHTMKPVELEKVDTPMSPPRSTAQAEKWKWDPPGDPEKTAAAIQIPPNVKFF